MLRNKEFFFFLWKLVLCSRPKILRPPNPTHTVKNILVGCNIFVIIIVLIIIMIETCIVLCCVLFLLLLFVMIPLFYQYYAADCGTRSDIQRKRCLLLRLLVILSARRKEIQTRPKRKRQLVSSIFNALGLYCTRRTYDGSNNILKTTQHRCLEPVFANTVVI